ncbi:uncharacterized protein LOC105075563 isoform X1 [Camelus bactrianus]|uniref:Uncharacterized protein LOC105075563 isoform X1 n=1 Tax=Camelus bactrianus TaxID=9837 RepID=A0AC58RD21_CAMBA
MSKCTIRCRTAGMLAGPCPWPVQQHHVCVLPWLARGPQNLTMQWTEECESLGRQPSACPCPGITLMGQLSCTGSFFLLPLVTQSINMSSALWFSFPSLGLMFMNFCGSLFSLLLPGEFLVFSYLSGGPSSL